MKKHLNIDSIIKLEVFIETIKGKRIVNSTSKIKKIIVIKKKCKENGRREEVLGSNPHSKGLDFSRSIVVFLEIKFKIKTIIVKINIIIKEFVIINFIIYTRI